MREARMMCSLLSISSVISRARKRKRRRKEKRRGLSSLASSSSSSSSSSVLVAFNLLLFLPITLSAAFDSPTAAQTTKLNHGQSSSIPLSASMPPNLYSSHPFRSHHQQRKQQQQQQTDAHQNDNEAIMSGGALNNDWPTTKTMTRQKRQSNNCSSSDSLKLGTQTAAQLFTASHQNRHNLILEMETGSEMAPNETVKAEQLKISQLLGRFYKLAAHQTNEKIPEVTSGQPQLRDLPRPENLTVLIISWYPPILKLSWQLKDLAPELNFFNTTTGHSSELSSDGRPDNSRSGEQTKDREEKEEVEELAKLAERQQLLAKALSRFQVTYNVVNSRFKIIEEYPPYRRSILLERLVPATEYSLRIRAVYLGHFVTISDRVQFVSPTDNESRRFKENTYRPIHRYPDEQPTVRPVGLAQVRSEELTIVVIAVMFWIATICLFFNKWGKIRMLEPYQPAYREHVEPPTATSSAFNVVGGVHRGSSIHNLAATATVAATGDSGSPSASGLFVACPKSGLLFEQQQHPLVGGQSGQLADGKRHSSCCELAQAAAGSVLLSSSSQQQQPSANQQTIKPADPQTTSDLAQCQMQQLQPQSQLQTFQALQKNHHHRPSKALALLREAQTIGSGGVGSVAAIELVRSGKAAAGTDSELNYLFQTKALALARVTRLWSKQQQHKRIGQYRQYPPMRGDSLATGPPPASATTIDGSAAAAATHRQASEAVSGAQANSSWMLLRQRPKPGPEVASRRRQTELLLSGRLVQQVPPPPPSPLQRSLDGCNSAAKQRQLNYQQQQQQSSLLLHTSDFSPTTPAMSSDRDTTTTATTRDTNMQAREKSNSQSCNIATSSSSSNRLRRLLFMSKQLQHHHVATSSSSSNLQQQPNATVGGSARRTSQNVASFDRHQTRSLDVQSAAGSQAGSQPSTVAFTAGDGQRKQLPVVSVSSSSLPIEANSSGGGGGSQQDNGQQPGDELDILIQPPSPPVQQPTDTRQHVCHQHQHQTRLVPQTNIERRRSATDRTLHSRLIDQQQQQVEICLQEAPDERDRDEQEQEQEQEQDDEQLGGDAFARLARCAARRRRLLAAAAAANCRPDYCGRMSDGRHQSFCCDSLALRQQQQQQRRTWTGTYLACGCPVAAAAASEPAQQLTGKQVGELTDTEQQQQDQVSSMEQAEQLGLDCGQRPRISSMFVASPYSRAHRDSFAMLRALSQKKSKSAEDVAYLSSLVLQIWAHTREKRNPLLQSVSSHQLSSSSLEHQQRSQQRPSSAKRPKSALTVHHSGYDLAQFNSAFSVNQ